MVDPATRCRRIAHCLAPEIDRGSAPGAFARTRDQQLQDAVNRGAKQRFSWLCALVSSTEHERPRGRAGRSRAWRPAPTRRERSERPARSIRVLRLGVDGHRTAERRSLAYHSAIAERLVRDPSIVERASARVAGWTASGAVHPKWSAAWSELLSRPSTEICDKLREPSEHMAALRQVTPFAGVLDARTRWALWRSVPR